MGERGKKKRKKRPEQKARQGFHGKWQPVQNSLRWEVVINFWEWQCLTLSFKFFLM
jgi:hypothetical protein